MFQTRLFFILFLIPFSLFAVFPQDKSDLAPEETIVWGTLDNGVRYAVMPNAEPPERVSMRLLVEAGSLMETDEQAGLAHFLEHMAFNGSEHFPPGELIEYLQRIGMSFGADTNAHTSFDETVYKLELPGNDEPMLREGLQVLRDYAAGLLLLEEEVDDERGVILSEKRARDSAQYRTTEAWFDFALPESKISKRLPIGEDEVIEKAPRERFVEFYEGWYTADRLAVVVVGDIQPEEAITLIKEYFDSVPKNENPRLDPDLGKLTSPTLATKLHSEPELPATTISIMSQQPDSGEDDSRAVRQKHLTISLANRIVSRRLDILAKEEGSPISEGSASWFDFMEFIEAAEVEVTCEPDKWQPALALAEQQLRQALQFGFTQAEVDEARANMLQGYQQAVREAPTRQSRSLSGGIAGSISEDMVFTSPQTDLEIAEEALAAATPESALAAFREIWGAPNRFLFVSGNLVLEDGDAQLAAAFAESAKTEVTPPEELETPDFAYTAFGAPGEIIAETFHEDLGIHQATFANQVRFNFKQTDYEAGQVLVTVRFGGGMLYEPEALQGISLFSEATFIRGGLEQHSYDELQRILAGKTVGLDFSVDESAFELSGSTNADDALLQLQILAAYLTAPGYRPEAARLAKQELDQLYIKIAHTAEGLLRLTATRMLAGGSYRFGYPPYDILMSRTQAESKAWLAKPLESAYLEISIIGDISYETARDAVAQTFGALSVRAETPQAFTDARASVKFPKTIGDMELTFESEIPRAIAAVYWPTDDFWDITRTRTLNVLGAVFRDRLRLEVREKLGEGYSPYAYNNSSETYDGYGLLVAINFCAPEKTQQVGDIIAGLGRDLGQGNITEDERDRALKPIVSQIPVMRRDNSYWLGRVLVGSSIRPEWLDFARSLPDAYPQISLEDLNASAKKFLGGEDSGLEILIAPTGKEK